MIAYDPRIPADAQAFEFVATGTQPDMPVAWTLNGKPLGDSADGRLLWPVARGKYTLSASQGASTATAHFQVK
jgi:membrane carboxypeptidase/penicillin-binding protein PbpC